MNSALVEQAHAMRKALKTAASDRLDDDSQAVLVALQTELDEYLVSAAANSQTPDSPQDSAIEHLEEIALRFEAEHPTVGTAIREAINTLVKAGI